MAAYRKLPGRVREWFRSSAQMSEDVDAEIAFHLEMRSARLEREGLSRADAERQARREFGDAGALRATMLGQERRTARRYRAAIGLDELRGDVRFSIRSLLRAPVFTAVALGTLVLGIGASVSIFAVVDAVLLRPLPYDRPERLVHVWPGHNYNMALADEVAGRARALHSWTGIAFPTVTLSGMGGAAELGAQAVHAGFFDVFSVRPQLGRPFGPEARDPARSDVVLLSDGLWRTRFAADRSIIGRRIALDGFGHDTREVIGIMPRGFVPPLAPVPVDLWVPLAVPAGRTVATDSTWYVNQVVGRLADGVAVEQLAAEVPVLLEHVRTEHPGRITEASLRDPGAVSLLQSLVGGMRAQLSLLLAAVALVLLLACANLGNLLLARGEKRRPELAARAALGGTRARLVRGLLTEAGVLALLGAAGGVLLASLILEILRVADTSGLPRMDELAIDARVLAFALAVSTACLLLFALLPALRITAGNLQPDLGSGRRTAGRSRGGRRFGAALIAGEVALAMVLVTGAALLLQSFRSVRAVPAGLHVDDVLAVTVAPSPARYDGARAVLLYEELLQRIEALPGVRAAGAIHLLPFTGSNWAFPYLAEGHDPPANAPLPAANFRVVTPGYRDAVDLPLLAGRWLESGDDASSDAVVINRRMAEELWPGQEAVGRTIRLFGSDPLRVVGVVGDVRQRALDTAPSPELYRTLAQWPLSRMVLMVESEGEAVALAGAVRTAVAALDGDIPLADVRPLADVLGESLAQRRFFAGVLSFFGALALLLGGVGVYGVMTYSVAARVPEFGVRLALGATHAHVLRQALLTGLLPVLAGAALGAAAALQVGRVLQSLLFGVGPRDPVALLTAGATMLAVAVLASWLPTRRVRAVEPMHVLNEG